MREFQITVDSAGAIIIDGSHRFLGYGGEHNVAKLNITFADIEQSVFNGAEYFRIAFDDYYSDAIYPENGTVEYTVPGEAVEPPSVHCQIVGYKTENGQPIKIAKSAVFAMEVKYSKVPNKSITGKTDVFERMLAACEVALKAAVDASDRAAESADSAALSSESAAGCSEISAAGAETATAKAEESAENAEKASAAAAKAEENMNKLGDLAELTDTAANALKGRLSGTVVRVDDTSPIEHNVAVGMSSESGADISGVTLKRYGKNLYPGVTNFPASIPAGVEATIENGGVRLTGTTNDLMMITIDPVDLPNGNYCASTTLEGTYHYVELMDGTYVQGTRSFTVTDTNKIKRIQVRAAAGTALNGVCYTQIESGTEATEYEQYVEPTEYTPNTDGTVEGVRSLYPTMTLLTDTQGVIIDCEYNRDINKAYAELTQAIINLGGTLNV